LSTAFALREELVEAYLDVVLHPELQNGVIIVDEDVLCCYIHLRPLVTEGLTTREVIGCFLEEISLLQESNV
jgi:hypothetical protein